MTGYVRWLGFILLLLIPVTVIKAQTTPTPAPEALTIQVVLKVNLPADTFSPDMVDAAGTIMAERLKSLDVKSYRIQVLGKDRIQVQLPSVKEPQATIKAISQTGLLEFVDFSGLKAEKAELQGAKIITSEQIRRGQPDNTGRSNPVTKKPFETILTGAALKSAQAQQDSFNQWVIAFAFKPEGAAIFGPFTEKHIGESVAIVLDGVVLSAPTVQSRLDQGGIISGNFTEQAAKTLAAQLQFGALPLPLVLESSDTVRTIAAGE